MSRSLPHRRAGSGPVLVLVHGYLGGSAQWEGLIADLSDRFDVIAPDLPGFGDAAHYPPLRRIADFAVSVLALLDDLGVEDFMLLGHSMGGMIAQEMAAIVPDRVRKLILYGTGPVGLMPDRFETIEASIQFLAREGVAAMSERIARTWFLDGAQGPGFPLTVQIGAKAAEGAACDALEAMRAWDGRHNLAALGMPTLIIWGEADQSYKWPQIETLCRNLPFAELARIPGAAHIAHLEDKDLFRSLVGDFLI